MAGSQGRPPDPEPPRSFRDALTSHATTSDSTQAVLDPTLIPPSDPNTIGTHKGHPAIFFPTPKVHDFTLPYEHTLVGKFSVGYNKTNPAQGRPSLDKLIKYFQALDLKGEFQLGLLDNRHVLIQLKHHLDYLRMYSRAVWYVGNLTMRVFKWTPSFHVDKESSLAPVWVTFPRLPIHFFNRQAMYGIASLLGVPLRLDNATLTLKRPSVARVQVEIDVLREHSDRVWIGVGDSDGFWQKVEFENMSAYCTHCWHMGHPEIQCHIHNPELRKGPVLRSGKSMQQVYVPIARKAPEKLSAQDRPIEIVRDSQTGPSHTLAKESTAPLDNAAFPSTALPPNAPNSALLAPPDLPMMPETADGPIIAPVVHSDSEIEENIIVEKPPENLVVVPPPNVDILSPSDMNELSDMPLEGHFQLQSTDDFQVFRRSSVKEFDVSDERLVSSATKSLELSRSRDVLLSDFQAFRQHLQTIFPLVEDPPASVPRKRGRPRKALPPVHNLRSSATHPAI